MLKFSELMSLIKLRKEGKKKGGEKQKAFPLFK